MQERDFQTKLTIWKKYNLKKSCLIEAKITKTDTIPFTRLEIHQKQALLLAKHDQLCYKIPDVGYDKKPADMFCLAGSLAYIAVLFYTEKGVKHFYLIDVDDWCLEEANSERRSLTEERAMVIGTRYELK